MAKELKIFDNKIIVLYILDNASKPLTLTQIVKFCEEFEDITYFDICEYLEELKASNYILEKLEDGTILYDLTDFGSSTLKELLELIPGVNLYNLKKMVNKNIIEIKTDYSIDTVIIPIKLEEYKVSCYIKDGNDELINITLYAGNKDQAKNISKNWTSNAEAIYAKLLEMMTNEKNTEE
ncbi:MAG: DUF4364 family protein [Clostridia bacterium]